MRIGLLADIHGNLLALDTVLGDLAHDAVDQLICLGDVAALGPQPREVIARLRELGCPVVMGNTDPWLFDSLAPLGALSVAGRAITRWCAGQLSSADVAYVRTFRPTVDLSLGAGTTLLCYHGSPRSFDDVIAATSPDDTVASMLGEHSASIMVGGHTHTQMVRRYNDALLINVGSIGLPGVNPGTPDLPVNQHVRWAEYGVLSLSEGRVSVDLRRIPLDVAALARIAAASGMPYPEWWLEKWDTSTEE